MPAAPAARASRSRSRRARAPRDPERQAQLADLLEVHLVARAVDRLAALVAAALAARRRVVAAGGGPLDDEAVHPAGGLAHQHGRERVAGDDGQELRAAEPRRRALPVTAADRAAGTGRRPRSPPSTSRRSAAGWCSASASSAAGISRGMPAPISTKSDPREHRAVQQRAGSACCTLVSRLMPTRPSWPSLRELDLDERREHGELLARLAHHLLVHGQHGVRRARRQALGAEVALQRIGCGLRDGEASPSRGACDRRGRRPAAGARARCRAPCPRPLPAGRGATRRCASRQWETPTPMPPWMMTGSTGVAGASATVVECRMSGSEGHLRAQCASARRGR